MYLRKNFDLVERGQDRNLLEAVETRVVVASHRIVIPDLLLLEVNHLQEIIMYYCAEVHQAKQYSFIYN